MFSVSQTDIGSVCSKECHSGNCHFPVGRVLFGDIREPKRVGIGGTELPVHAPDIRFVKESCRLDYLYGDRRTFIGGFFALALIAIDLE